jgi:surface antigen
MPYFARLGLALSLCVIAANSPRAQLSGFYPIGSDAVSLNNEDFTMLIDAANGLLRRPHLAKGDNADWRNKQSGSYGTISVTDSFHHAAWLCHTLTYRTNPTGASQANTLHLNWCRTPEGWKVLS